MFFKYNVLERKSDKIVLLNNAKQSSIKTDNKFIAEYLAEACAKKVACKNAVECKEINIHIGIPDEIKAKLGDKYEANEEGYVIDAGEVTNVYGETERAIIHSISTINQLIKEGEFTEMFLYDRPALKMRGFKMFLPGRNQIENFKKTVNEVLLPYKCNFVFMETAGGLEYKRHPKINEEWEKFATRMLEDSGIADKLQHFTYPWCKNAIHPEVGGGSYITQEEAKEVAKYCEERGLEIILNIPGLSHADYIVRAYPELNERKEDPDPDHYCPSNPKTYEVMFDIIDENLEVFENCRYISIGHDEVVSIGLCDKCKDKDPVDLFIGDIEKLNDYIKSKGRKTIVSCDKFTKLYKDGKTPEEANYEPYIDEKGKLCGGLEGFEKGDSRYVPALHTAIDRLPKDITITNWYWYFGQDNGYTFDDTFKGHKLIMTNCHASNFRGWETRVGKTMDILGLSNSNWGRNDYINAQRNCAIYHTMFNSCVAWDEDYTDADNSEVFEKVRKEQNLYYNNNILKMSPDKKYITVTHTTNHNIPYRAFYDGDFVKEEDYYMGDYIVTYADETTHAEPVYYGENISNENVDITKPSGALNEVSGMSYASKIDKKTYYTWTFENPYGDKEIKDINFVSSGKFEGAKVYTKEIVY